MKVLLCLAPFALASVGCASAAHVVPDPSLGQFTELHGPGLDDPEIEQDGVRYSTPGPLFPSKLAVVRVYRGRQGFLAAPPSRSQIAPFRAAFDGMEKISELEPLPSLLLPGSPRLSDLRSAASRMGARLLIVYATDARHDIGWTGAAKLNWLIVPFFVIPSTEVYAAAACEGLLLDVATNRVLAVAQGFAESEGVYWNLSPLDDAIRRTEEDLSERSVRTVADEFAGKVTKLR